MIVLNANGTPLSTSGLPAKNDISQPLSRNSTSNRSASDGSSTPMEGKMSNPLNGFFLQLGLDGGSLDLKGDSSESESSMLGKRTLKLFKFKNTKKYFTFVC